MTSPCLSSSYLALTASCSRLMSSISASPEFSWFCSCAFALIERRLGTAIGEEAWICGWRPRNGRRRGG
jgi:hypothetical protein